MVRNKHNFKVGEEFDFPDVDIVPDQSISINKLIYNVMHGLPTGIAEPYQEFDEEDSDPDGNSFDDGFDLANYIMQMVSDVVDSETKREQTEEKQSAPPSGKENTQNEDEQSDV